VDDPANSMLKAPLTHESIITTVDKNEDIFEPTGETIVGQDLSGIVLDVNVKKDIESENMETISLIPESEKLPQDLVSPLVDEVESVNKEVESIIPEVVQTE
jgi:glycine cleavage system H lipoate-binding protein